MIDRSKVEFYISICNNYTILSVDQETSFYKIGSIERGKNIRGKIIYLEFYQFALNELLLFYDAGLDHEDYGISDSQINKYFYYIDELIKVLFL